MTQSAKIPSHLLFTCHNTNSIEEDRRDKASYYLAHHKFEYEFVLLMEVAYILCIQENRPLDEYETKSKHNRLSKIMLRMHSEYEMKSKSEKKNEPPPFVHKDMKDPPYFRALSWEYWVTPEIATYLIELMCNKNPIEPAQPMPPKVQSKKAKQKRPPKLCIKLLNFLRPYAVPNSKFEDWQEIWLQHHLVEDSYQFVLNKPHEKWFTNYQSKAHEIRIAYIQCNNNGTHFLHYYWLIPHKKKNDEKNDYIKSHDKSFQAVKRHFNALLNEQAANSTT